MSEREHGDELVQAEPEVIRGEDDIPRQPAPPLDAFTPEPYPRPGERRAFRVMRMSLVLVAIVVAIVIYAAFR